MDETTFCLKKKKKTVCLGRTSSGRGRRCLSPSADSRKCQASAANSPSVELPEFERLDPEKSPLFTPLVDGSMASASAMVPLVKVEKKIAQISRVIQHLNAKSDDSDLDSLAGGRVGKGGASVTTTGQPRQLFARQASAGELPRIHCRLLQALHQPLLTPQAVNASEDTQQMGAFDPAGPSSPKLSSS